MRNHGGGTLLALTLGMELRRAEEGAASYESVALWVVVALGGVTGFGALGGALDESLIGKSESRASVPYGSFGRVGGSIVGATAGQVAAPPESVWWASGAGTRSPKQIAAEFENSGSENPPLWAIHSASRLFNSMHLLAGRELDERLDQGPGASIARDDLEDVLSLDGAAWQARQDELGIDALFSLQEVQEAADAMLKSGLFDYLDSPPNLETEPNGIISRETLWFFASHAYRGYVGWEYFLGRSRRAAGPTAIYNEPVYYRDFDHLPLFAPDNEAGSLFRSLFNRLGFEPIGISASDVVQGKLGNCYFLAALAALAESDPLWIKDHIQQNPDRTYTVTFYDADGLPVEITVDNLFAQGLYGTSAFAQPRGDMWVMVYEKAYAKFLDGRNGVTDGYDAIDAGLVFVAMRDLTGAVPRTLYLPDERSNAQRVVGWFAPGPDTFMFEMETSGFRGEYVDTGRLKDTILDWQGRDQPITAGTGSVVSELGEQKGVATEHSYAVIEADDNGVVLYNPWGQEYNIELTYEEFADNFESVSSIE